MTEYSVIYEQAGAGSWSVRAVDLPVFYVGDSRDEAAESIREAIALYLEGGDAPSSVSRRGPGRTSGRTSADAYEPPVDAAARAAATAYLIEARAPAIREQKRSDDSAAS